MFNVHTKDNEYFTVRGEYKSNSTYMNVRQLQVQEKQQQEHFLTNQCQKATFASTPPMHAFSATRTV